MKMTQMTNSLMTGIKMKKLDHQKHLDKPRTEIRAKAGKMADESQIKTLLHSSPFGHMASVHGDQPFLIPLLYVYDEGNNTIYFHGAAVGRARANIEINPNVCFNVTSFGRILPAESIIKFDIEYQSVTVFGTAKRIDDPKERERALILLAEKFAPYLTYGEDYPPLTADEIKGTAIFEIAIEEWSGKHNEESPDFPNAFIYPNFPEKKSK